MQESESDQILFPNISDLKRFLSIKMGRLLISIFLKDLTHSGRGAGLDCTYMQELTCTVCVIWIESSCLPVRLPYSASKLCCLPTHTQVAAAMWLCTPHIDCLAQVPLSMYLDQVPLYRLVQAPLASAEEETRCSVVLRRCPRRGLAGLLLTLAPAKSCGKQEGSVIRAQLLTVRVTSWSRLAPSQGWTLPMAWLPVDWVEEVEEEEEEVEEAKMQAKIYLGGGILHKLEQVAKCGTGYL